MSDHHTKKEIDDISGIETTGHEWDGLKELNNPAPRWWLWVFYICCLWSFAYWVLYPAWPTLSGATKGTLGVNQHVELERAQAEIAVRRAEWADDFAHASFEDIKKDQKLFTVARAGGAAAFKDNCATCHGTGAAGGKGYPNLNDDDWLWGGTVEDIHQTLLYGVRSGHDEGHTSQMPAFGRDGLLKPTEIVDVSHYVVALSDRSAKLDMPGAAIYATNCASCHGEAGQGVRDFGGPRLNDAIWLYGGTVDDVVAQVTNPRHGVMPYWAGRLDPQTIRQLALYVHSLGGGEEATIPDVPVEQAPITPVVSDTAPEDLKNGTSNAPAP